MDENEPFSMVQEAVDSYAATDLPDGRLEIRILIPRRFAALWLVKLCNGPQKLDHSIS
jgi:hypothetical protein